jgi:hypothetical protein
MFLYISIFMFQCPLPFPSPVPFAGKHLALQALEEIRGGILSGRRVELPSAQRQAIFVASFDKLKNSHSDVVLPFHHIVHVT